MEIVPYNGTTLAFIGDAVMTLKVRELLVSRGLQKPNELQRMTAKWVSAKAQAYYLMTLIDKGFFTEEELAIIRRGRNAQTASIAKNADVAPYRLATGLVAIWGYYQLSGELLRMEQLWNEIVMLGAQ